MQVYFTERFRKKFKKLPAKIQAQFERRLNVFIKNSSDPFLKVHPLKGSLMGYRAFSVTGDYRVIYQIMSKESVKLIDIGTHSQVY